MGYEFLSSCGFMTFSGVLLAAGIPCWIVGVTRPHYYISNYLYSVPLFPKNPGDILSVWSCLNRSSRSNELTIQIFLSDFPKHHLNQKMSCHLLHNVWGLNITVSAHWNMLSLLEYSQSKNMISISSEDNDTTVQPGHLPSDLKQHGSFRIKCPFSTKITQEYQIEPSCTREIGAFFNLPDEYYTQIDIGDFELNGQIDFEKNTVKFLTVTFHNLEALPKDFVTTPQMYVAFWNKSDSTKLIISGATLTSSGLVVLIISVVIFFACYVGTNDETTDRNQQ